MESVFNNFIGRIRELAEKKKNNFVFNYLAYSFEKGTKFYMIKWKRIIKKIALQQFYLNQDDDDDVIDLEEEKKKMTKIKENSLIVKRFRNITYRNLRSKVSQVKDNFFKWRDTTMRLRILALKQLRILRQFEEKGITQVSSSEASQETKDVIYFL